MMVGDGKEFKCGKRVYKAIRKYASFINGETSLCGSPFKKFKVEEEEVSERVVDVLRSTEDFLDYVCCGFKTEMAKEFLSRDLHMPLLEGECMGCDTPPNSLSGLKASSTHSTAAPPLLGAQHHTNTLPIDMEVRSEKNEKKLNKNSFLKKESKLIKSVFSKKSNVNVLNSGLARFGRVKQIPIVEISKTDKLQIINAGGVGRANAKVKRTRSLPMTTTRNGSERKSRGEKKMKGEKGGGRKDGLKERLRASTKALSSASHQQHLSKKLSSACHTSINATINTIFKHKNIKHYNTSSDHNHLDWHNNPNNKHHHHHTTSNTETTKSNNNHNHKNHRQSNSNSNKASSNFKNTSSSHSPNTARNRNHNINNNNSSNTGKPSKGISENETVDRTVPIELIRGDEDDFQSIPLLINKLCQQQQQPLFHVSPPPTFKVECTVPQQTRFSTHNQYVHRFSNRWGHNSLQLACITAHLDSQGAIFNSHPLVGGVEVDLVGLMEGINTQGGLQRVIDKNLWADVVACMHVPKTTRDKVSRFYEIYCRHLLSYDTLPPKEKLRLLKHVNASMFSEHSDDLCVSKGRCRNLGELYVVARNVASMMEMEEASNKEVLHRYWRVVEEASPHLSVNTAFIKPSDVNTCRRNRSFRSSKMDITSLIRCCSDGLCPLFADEEVIDSRLEVEMMFSSRCWSRDQHGRGLIAYNHTGADVVWYCIKGEDEEKFKDFLALHFPHLVSKQQHQHWLSPNHVMVSPGRLMQAGVKVYSCTQEVGHLVIIPPSSFFSSVSCGYSVSEHAHFLPHDWLLLASEASKSLHQCSIVPMFSMERFLVSLLSREVFIHEKVQQLQQQQQQQTQLQQQQQTQQTPKRHLSDQQVKQAFSLLNHAIGREIRLRKLLADMAVRRRMERVLEGGGGSGGMGGGKVGGASGGGVGSDSFMHVLMQHKISICSSSKAFCFFSKTVETSTNSTLCTECAYKRLQGGAKACHYESVLFFNHSELQDLLSRIRKAFNLSKEGPPK